MTTSDPLTRQITDLSRVSDETVSELANGDVREELLVRIVQSAPDAPAPQPGRRRHRLPIIAAASATTVVAGAAIGWAITNSGATDTVSVQCVINGADSIIPANSGDPVADCEAEWQRQTGTTAPPLRAYDNGHGGITVTPATQPPAPSAVPLPPGTTQNVTAISLQESLDDYVAGLNSGCYSAEAATNFVRQQLDTAGLSDWTVSAPPGGADGTTSCTDAAIVDAKTDAVLLRALGGPTPPDLPFMKLAQRLRQLSRCQTADVLARRVEAIVTDLGLSEAAHQYELTTVTDASRCAIVHETVGGTIFLTVRGPQG